MKRIYEMKPSPNTMIHFYQHLGKLFYSIALVDGTVRKEEIEKLVEIVQKEWVPIETTSNEFGDDSAYQIEIVFDWLIEENRKTSKVIPNFESFKKEHPSIFTPQVNDLILKTAKAISSAFSEKNKSEPVLINKLKSILYHEH